MNAVFSLVLLLLELKLPRGIISMYICLSVTVHIMKNCALC